MKKLFLILFIVNCTLQIANAQWTQLPNLPVTGTVRQMFFVNVNTGWMSLESPSSFIKTTNGGQTWNVLLNTGQVLLFTFFNDTLGVSLDITGTQISRSTNGGANWNVTYTTGNVFQNIFFINKDTGWVCGFDGTFGGVWRTTDAGNSFIRQYTSNSNGLDKIFFLKYKVNGEYWGWTLKTTILFKTTNSGVNWFALPNDLGSGCGDGADFYFLDTAIGVMVRSSGCFSKTTNGGSNWINRPEPNITSGCRITMGNQNTGWISVAEDSIIKTVNFFQTYGKQTTPVIATKIFALDTTYVWGGLNMNNMMKTTNGGGNIVLIEQVSSEVPEKFYLFQNYPNPFNPTAVIKYDLPNDVKVLIRVYDILGREVKKLVDEFKKAGSYEINFYGTNLASGVYFYRIEAGNFVEAKKMVLVK